MLVLESIMLLYYHVVIIVLLYYYGATIRILRLSFASAVLYSTVQTVLSHRTNTIIHTFVLCNNTTQHQNTEPVISVWVLVPHSISSPSPSSPPRLSTHPSSPLSQQSFPRPDILLSSPKQTLTPPTSLCCAASADGGPASLKLNLVLEAPALRHHRQEPLLILGCSLLTVRYCPVLCRLSAVSVSSCGVVPVCNSAFYLSPVLLLGLDTATASVLTSAALSRARCS
jgi:hypothetical protein